MKKKIMILGSGELGKEFAISAQRLGQHIIAVDNYENAPAMQVAHEYEVINMLDGHALEKIVKKHKPDIIVPEVESIRTEKLKQFEEENIFVVPTAEATHLTMNRDAIRDLAANELDLKTPKFFYASSASELENSAQSIGFPCVVKPVMSSSGKGQSVVNHKDEILKAWDFACQGARGDKHKVIVEEFIRFEQEITLLTVKQFNKPTIFVQPIGHRQERGDYQESWLPANLDHKLLEKAQHMAKKVTDRLGGAGLFGVEFFITKDDVYFSELSPRPHDTGMVTLVSQNLSEFDLHLRAILGLNIPNINYYQPSASHVVLASETSSQPPSFSGVDKALEQDQIEVRIFNKPNTRPYRRMAVTLASAESTDRARKLAKTAAQTIQLEYQP